MRTAHRELDETLAVRWDTVTLSCEPVTASLINERLVRNGRVTLRLNRATVRGTAPAVPKSVDVDDADSFLSRALAARRTPFAQCPTLLQSRLGEKPFTAVLLMAMSTAVFT